MPSRALEIAEDEGRYEKEGWRIRKRHTDHFQTRWLVPLDLCALPMLS